MLPAVFLGEGEGQSAVLFVLLVGEEGWRLGVGKENDVDTQFGSIPDSLNLVDFN